MSEFDDVLARIDETVERVRGTGASEHELTLARAMAAIPALQMLSEVIQEELEGLDRATEAFQAYEELATGTMQALLSALPDADEE